MNLTPEQQRSVLQHLDLVQIRLSGHVTRLANSGAVGPDTTGSDIIRVALEDLAAEFKETPEVKNLRCF